MSLTDIRGDTRIIDLTVDQFQQLIVDAMKKNPAMQNEEKSDVLDLVSIEEAMKITNLARQTIYGLVCHRKIPFIKKSRKLYFSRKKLNAWIQGID
jgi:hypothetical protein